MDKTTTTDIILSDNIYSRINDQTWNVTPLLGHF